MTRTLVVAAALLGAAVTLAAVAFGDSTQAVAQNAERGVLRTACMDDFKKFCPNVQPGGGRIVQCLRAHEKELTPACRDGLASAKR